MTDITELAQRLKLEVHRAVSNFNPQMNIKTRDLKELVEALEKAKGSEELQARIAELEESNVQVIQSRDHYKRMTEEGLKQLAEARTVKLPKFKMLEDYLAEVAIEERKQILVGVKLEFHRALSDAGIKVEAE
ncbi:TPA: hypothetical protein ACN689_001527 [Klebsiella pneumoniae]